MRLKDQLLVTLGVALICGAILVHEVAGGIMGRGRRRRSRNNNRLATIAQAVENVQVKKPSKAERREANRLRRVAEQQAKVEKSRNDYLDWCCQVLQSG